MCKTQSEQLFLTSEAFSDGLSCVIRWTRGMQGHAVTHASLHLILQLSK